MKLTEEQMDILRNKYPVYLEERLKLLYQLDKACEFNRIKLSRFLKSYKLSGYSTRQLGRLLGKAVYTTGEYRKLRQLVDPDLLDLLCSRRVRKKIQDLQFKTESELFD